MDFTKGECHSGRSQKVGTLHCFAGRYFQGQRPRTFPNLPKVREHSKIQGVPQGAKGAERRREDLPFYGQFAGPYLDQEYKIYEGARLQVDLQRFLQP